MSDFPKALAFAAHFTDPIYDDEGEEFAPFGSDEGWDMLAGWSEHPEDLGPDSAVRDVLLDFAEDPDAVDSVVADALDGAPDLASVVVGAGFTLLRLTGRIDAEGRAWTLGALAALEQAYADAPRTELRPLQVMRRDLMSFTA